MLYRIVAFIALAWSLTVSVAQAQDRFYHVYIDKDANSASGCQVDLPDFSTSIDGVESRLTVTTNNALPPVITATNLHQCNGASFGAGTAVDPAALGLNTGVAGADVIEAGISVSELSLNASGNALFYYATESDTASDIVLTNAAGGPIFLGFAFPVPALGFFAIGLLLLLLAFSARKNFNKHLSLTIVLMGLSTLAYAMNIIIDGQTGDWTGINPANTDPINDTSVTGSFADLTAVFLTKTDHGIFFRMDLTDVENQAPVANPTSDTTSEENAVTITVTGSDAEGSAVTFAVGTAPADGTLGAFTVVNNTTSTVTYTPNPDFAGTDSFTIVANDSQVSSAPATVTVTVTPINDAPSFTSGGNVNVLKTAGAYNEVWATNVIAGPADESAQNLTFNVLSNDNNAIFNVQPSIDSSGTLSFTGVPDATGTANLTVNLTDDGGVANGGVDTSVTVNFTIILQGVNDEPSFIAGGDQVLLEDAGAQTIAGWATAMSAGPADESGQVLTFAVTNNDDPTLFSVAPQINATTGDLTFTTAPDANGLANISVVLMDDGGTANGGDDTSSTASFNIAVTAVNDAPSFTAGTNQSVLEDSPAQTINNWATAISSGPTDESAQSVSFNVSNNNNTLFSVQPNIDQAGNLTFTPAPGELGSADVSVTISDNGGLANGGVDTSLVQAFIISVTMLNDAPSFTVGADLTSDEDAGVVSVANWASNILAGPPDEAGQVLTFNITANDNTALFSAGPTVAANGTLTYTATADANGTANITLELMDDGGTASGGVDTSPPQSFSITIDPVNDVPSFTSGGDVTVDEDSGAVDTAWASDISAGPANESAQTLSFNIMGFTNPTLFSAAPSVDGTGDLSFTPAAGEFGTATVTINLMDNGGTTNGGIDSSANITFDITVSEVNEAPVLNNIVNPSVDELVLLAFTATATDPNVPAQTLTFSLGGTVPAGASITAGGDFTWTPTEAQGNTGTFTFDVIVTDDGTNPDDLTDSQSITVTVNKVNSVPTLSAIGAQSIDELVALNFTATATDTDLPTQNLTFSLGGTVPAGATISAAGAFSWTPTEAQGPGVYNFDVIVTDNGTNPSNLTDTETISVTVNAVNTAPVLGAIGSLVINEETLLSFNATATDSDLPTQALTFSLSGTVPTGASITAGGAFSWTPTEAQGPGNYSFAVVVTDDGSNPANLTDSENITVTVNEVNAAPTANAQSTTTNDATPIVITLTGSDPEGDTLTFSVVSSPAVGSLGTITSINATSASVTYTPSAVGTGDFTFRANDGFLNSPAATVTLPVTSSNTAPTGVNDAYNVTGNVGINVPLASGVTSNDTDPELDTLTVTAFDATSTQGGTVAVNANGSFTYDPPAGYTGADSFGYTVSDGVLTDTATVNLTVASMIWFIDNSAVAGDGRLNTPFNTIASFNSTATDAIGDVIHIDLGDGTSTGYNTGITLLNTQRLLGQGVALSTANTGITYPSHSRTLPAAASNPTIVTTNANSITLGSGNIVRGLTVGNTGSGTGITGNNFGALTINNVSTSGTGKALDLTSGSITAVFDSITSTSSASESIDINNVTGSFSVNGGSISGAGANASTVLINNSGGTITANFNGINVGANNATSGENGIHFFTNGTADGNLNVNGSAFTGSRRGMILAEISGSNGGTINIGNTTANMFTQDQSPDVLGGDDVIHITANGSGTINTNISNNTIISGVFTFEGDGIAVQNLSTFSGTHQATIESNTIGVANTNGSAFDPLDNQGDAGIEIIGTGNNDMIALVNNNNVYDYNASGIEITFTGTGNYDATITNNTVSDGLGSSGIDSGIALIGTDDPTSCIQIDNNSINDPSNDEIVVDIFGGFGGSYRDPGLTVLNDAALVAHLLSTNSGTVPYTALAFTEGVSGGGAACVLP